MDLLSILNYHVKSNFISASSGPFLSLKLIVIGINGCKLRLSIYWLEVFKVWSGCLEKKVDRSISILLRHSLMCVNYVSVAAGIRWQPMTCQQWSITWWKQQVSNRCTMRVTRRAPSWVLQDSVQITPWLLSSNDFTLLHLWPKYDTLRVPLDFCLPLPMILRWVLCVELNCLNCQCMHSSSPHIFLSAFV